MVVNEGFGFGSKFPAIDYFINSSGSADQLLYVVLVVTVIDGPAYWEMACTGTLIRADLVLTMASCLTRLGAEPDPYNTLVYERHTGIAYRALKVFLHPLFLPNDSAPVRHFDFAMIKIESTNQTELPSLPSEGQYFNVSSDCRMGGYGNKARFDLGSFKLISFNKTSWTVIKCRVCSSQQTCILCLHFREYKPCRVDVGTPIVCNGTIIAIYTPKIESLTVDCLESYVYFFSYVTDSLDWLEAVVNAREDTNLLWMNNSFFFLMACIVVIVSMVAIYMIVAGLIQRKIDDKPDSLPSPTTAALRAMASTSSVGSAGSRTGSEVTPNMGRYHAEK